MKPKGIKYDNEKPRYSLIPAVALDEVVKVLTYGAQKYSPENWRYVENAYERYFDALQRHVWAWKRGEQTDSESGLHHLAHAICSAMFIIELELGKDNDL